MKIDCTKDEYQQKTYMEDFFEKFPNAPRHWGVGGTPVAAWCRIYGISGEYTCAHDCTVCWNQSMKNKPSEEVERRTPRTSTKTYEEDFFEKFPNAPKEDDGTPVVCWGDIYDTGGCEDDYEEITCAECWTELM